MKLLAGYGAGLIGFRPLGQGTPGGGGGGPSPSYDPSLYLLGDDYTSGNWPDQSGNGNDATEGVSPPTLETNVLDGHSAVRFDGITQFLTVADDSTLDATTALTIMIVASSESATAGVTHWLTKEADTSSGDASYSIAAASLVQAGLAIKVGSWAGYFEGTSSLTSDGTKYLVTVTFDGSAYAIRVNGVLVWDGSLSGTITTTTGALTIGGLLASFSLAWLTECDIMAIEVWKDNNAPTSGTALTDREDAFLAMFPSL